MEEPFAVPPMRIIGRKYKKSKLMPRPKGLYDRTTPGKPKMEKLRVASSKKRKNSDDDPSLFNWQHVLYAIQEKADMIGVPSAVEEVPYFRCLYCYSLHCCTVLSLAFWYCIAGRGCDE